jgi:hypothetical protein
VSGGVQRGRWDYKSAEVAQSSETSIVNHGQASNDLAQLLSESVIDVSHAGNLWTDYDLLAFRSYAQCSPCDFHIVKMTLPKWFTARRITISFAVLISPEKIPTPSQDHHTRTPDFLPGWLGLT